MRDIPDLQQLINFKAQSRLDKDLSELSELIRNNRLLQITDSDTIPDLIFDHTERKPYWIFKKNSAYMNAVKTYWLPIYQNEESQKFIQKVDDLNNAVANLMSNENYD